MMRRGDRGFTLPELLVTIALLGIIGFIAALLLQPADFSAEGLKASRRTDIAAIVQALHKYQTTNGTLPSGMPSVTTEIGSLKGDYNLCHYLVPSYVTNLPIDSVVGIAPAQDEPCDSQGAQYETGYTISRNRGGQVMVGSIADQSLRLTVP